MATRSRPALLTAVAVVVVVASGVTPVALADEGSVATWPDGPERIFYADDPESASLVNANDSNLAQLAAAFDVHFRTTNPSIGADEPSYVEYRIAELNSVERERHSSKYLPQSSLSDGGEGVVKDAHVTYLGTARGATPQTPIEETDQEFILSDGRVLNFLDYRIDESALPDSHTERVDPNVTVTRTGHGINWGETGVEERTVTVNGRVVGSASGGPDARVINYTGATGDGTVTLTVETRIVAVMDYKVIRTRNGTIVDTDYRTREIDSVTVRDEVTVRVVDDQSLSVSQRFIDVEGRDESLLTVRFDGPNSLATRQLWSELRLDEGTSILNNWGVYSTTRYSHGHVATEGGTSEYAFPHVLHTKFTSSNERPDIRMNRSRTEFGGVPEISKVEQQNLTDAQPSLAERVNTTTTQPTTVDLIVVSDVPGPIANAVDIFGRTVNVNTESELTVQRSALDIVSSTDERVRVRLYDPDTGDGLGGRQLAVYGGAEDAYTTAANGTVTIETAGSYLRVEFAGDEWREDVRAGSIDGPYYAESSVEDSLASPGRVAEALVAFARAGVLSFPFLLGYLLVRSINNAP